MKYYTECSKILAIANKSVMDDYLPVFLELAKKTSPGDTICAHMQPLYCSMILDPRIGINHIEIIWYHYIHMDGDLSSGKEKLKTSLDLT